MGRFCDGVVFVGNYEDRIDKDGCGRPVFGVFNQLFHIYLRGDRASRTKLGFLLVEKSMAGTLKMFWECCSFFRDTTSEGLKEIER